MRKAMLHLLAAVLILLGAAGLSLADVSAPEGLKDIPLTDGAKIISAVSQEDSQAITVEAPGDQKKIKEFYKAALTKAGWKIEMEMENAEMVLLSLAKGEWKLAITANNIGDNKVAYSIGRGKE
jgi:hypothetical protein